MTMNKLLLPILFLMLFPLVSYSGDTRGAIIANSLSTREGVLLISLSVPHEAPTCGARIPYRYAIAATNKTAIAAALMAQTTGKTVDIFGLNNCDVWGDTESVLYLVVF